jgi:hypothetical protein
MPDNMRVQGEKGKRGEGEAGDLTGRGGEKSALVSGAL